jgi:hypothetical protein
MMKTLQVALGDRSYPIHIGENLLSGSDLFTAHIRGKEVLIVTNETVAPLYLDTVKTALKDYRLESVILPDGEQYKTLDTMQLIFDRLLEARLSRQCYRRYGRICCSLLSAGGALYPGSHHLIITGRLFSWRQNRGQSSVRQKYDWCVLPAAMCTGRYCHVKNVG